MRKVLIIAAALLILIPPVFAQNTGKSVCGRACLEDYVDRYLDAMLENDPSLELFSRDCKFTENGVRLPLGNEGLWFGMSARGGYKFYVPDVETQQVAFLGAAREGSAGKQGEGALVAVALRLKISNGLIAEAEQLVIRPASDTMGMTGALSTGARVEKLGAPHAIFREEIPEAERASREELIHTADYYFSGMQKNDGKGYYPFTDDCHRVENGMPATNVPVPAGQQRPDPKTATMYSSHWGCKEQFESGLLNFVTRIRDRRFVAVDRERGVVFAFGFFDHDSLNWTWQLAELFKIENGNIRRIETIFHRCPYGMNSGWSTYEQGMSDGIQSIR
ncbi:MAG: hypothetical protein JW793_09795 [Acidobacteria bacterium]|nr:hypothetical protein [Acidobacteriota bacterium]